MQNERIIMLAQLLKVTVLALLCAHSCFAESFLLPLSAENSIVGKISYQTALKNDTLLDIARVNGFGYYEIIKANPHINRWVPGEGTKVVLPGMHILPKAQRKGIVINLAEMRLYYFPQYEVGVIKRVHVYPVSIGRMNWKSPIGTTFVSSKEKNPNWYPPESIRMEHLNEGEYLGKFIPGGDPNNPLGHYALRLALPGYLIHGTNEQKEYGIGMNVTHGCIRMYPEDIEQLFNLVPINTTVAFIDQPIKFGWSGAKLFMEIHKPPSEEEEEFEQYSHQVTIEDVKQALKDIGTDELVFRKGIIESILERGDGLPAIIAETKSGLPPAAR